MLRESMAELKVPIVFNLKGKISASLHVGRRKVSSRCLPGFE